MKDKIISNIDNSKELEKLFRHNPSSFRREFNLIYPEIKHNQLADFWNERLNYDINCENSESTGKEIKFAIFASLFAVFLAKIPYIFHFDESFYFMRNTGFIVFPVLMIYFARADKLSKIKAIAAGSAVLIAAIFINLLSINAVSDTLKLSCLHLPLFLWILTGFVYAGDGFNDYRKRMDFLRFNGDFIIITTVILIAGIILTGITQGLFSLIGLKIFDFYKEFIIIPGLAITPVVGTYMIRKNPQLVSRVSPLIAKIFSPLVLLTLTIYLIAIIVTGKDPYGDREFLLTFNIMLIAVMSIIVFSVAGIPRSERNRMEIIILFLLSFVTVIVNCIALSAILFRISEWGITPNRLAVLGGNILILINLLLVTYKLFRTVFKKSGPEEVEMIISKFLPVYFIWSVIVVFLFPFVFGFR